MVKMLQSVENLRLRSTITEVFHSIRMSQVTRGFRNFFYELISIYLIFLVTGVPKSEPKDIRIERNTPVISGSVINDESGLISKELISRLVIKIAEWPDFKGINYNQQISNQC